MVDSTGSSYNFNPMLAFNNQNAMLNNPNTNINQMMYNMINNQNNNNNNQNNNFNIPNNFFNNPNLQPNNINYNFALNQMMMNMLQMNPMMLQQLMNMMKNQNPNNNNNNNNYINLIFRVNNEYKITIPTNYNEYLSSVVNKYINKSNDTNINYYLFNGQRLNESLTVGQQGLMDGSHIYVVRVQNILGAFK